MLGITKHKFIEENATGRDFFVGDVHGQYNLLNQALNFIQFDYTHDRLFSTGDLIDRGDESLRCLLLANENWMNPVLGNHETFLIEFTPADSHKIELWRRNGGAWWQDISDGERTLAKEIVKQDFSLTLSVETKAGKVGVVHAQYPFAEWPLNENKSLNERELKEILWGRDRIRNKLKTITQGVSYVVTGHTPLNAPVFIGNQLCLDTGSGYQNNLRLHEPHLTLCEFQATSIEFIHSYKSGIEKTTQSLP